jgi:hypothetical protein
MTVDDDSTGFSVTDYIKWRDTRKWVPTGPLPSYYSLSVKPVPPILTKKHWNAAGDFTLCTRRALYRVGGYDERSYRTHVDSLLLRQAEKCGISLRVFHPSLSVFHQVFTTLPSASVYDFFDRIMLVEGVSFTIEPIHRRVSCVRIGLPFNGEHLSFV